MQVGQTQMPNTTALQRSAPSARNCFICMDRLEGKSMTVLKCSHELCSGCWQKWVVTRIKEAYLKQKAKSEVRCPLCRQYHPVSADQTKQAEQELNAEGYKKQPNINLWIMETAPSPARAESFVAPLPAAPQPAAPHLNRVGTLFSSGLSVGGHVVRGEGVIHPHDFGQRSNSAQGPAIRQALGICPHGNHRSMCPLCDPARAAARERLRVQGAFDVDPAGAPSRCQSVLVAMRCTVS